MQRDPRSRTCATRFAVSALALLLGAEAVSAQTPSDATEPPLELLSYGFVRIVEGDLTILQDTTGAELAGQRHQPVMVGDRLSVSPDTRVEILLADRNVLRVQGEADLLLERLAYSADTRDDQTQIRLERGLFQIVVTSRFLGIEPPRIDTPDARFHLREPGKYLVEVDATPATRLLVREGSAETFTPRGSWLVQTQEALLVEGEGAARIEVYTASAGGPFEDWADGLDRRAEVPPQLDPDLGYAAATMEGYGTWLDVDGQSAWKPRVDASWRPYRNGTWSYTPSGLTWRSSEPWGWVPYHYGYWDLTPSQGWIWRPGALYSPAWVTWYWGPAYVGWIPTGPYFGYLPSPWARYRFGPWSGGWGRGNPYWTFCPTPYFGSRWTTPYRRWAPGQGVAAGVPPGAPHSFHSGFLTTDTRGLTPDVWNDGSAAIAALRNAKTSRARPATLAASELAAPYPRRVSTQARPGAATTRNWRDAFLPPRPSSPPAAYGGLLRGDRWARHSPATPTPHAGQGAAFPRIRPEEFSHPVPSWSGGYSPSTFRGGSLAGRTRDTRGFYRPEVYRPSTMGRYPAQASPYRPPLRRPSFSPPAAPHVSPMRPSLTAPTARTPTARPGSAPQAVRPAAPPRQSSGRPRSD